MQLTGTSISVFQFFKKEMNVRELMLHQHDNAFSHTAKLTVKFLDQKHIKEMEHPFYTLNIAIWDFWLLFNLKQIYVVAVFIPKIQLMRL